MAKLIIEHGASPQDGQKKIINYIYTERGAETQDVTYEYTETAEYSPQGSYFMPITPEVNEIEINDLLYYDTDQQLVFTIGLNYNTRTRTINAGTRFETEVVELVSVSVVYGDGSASGVLYPRIPTEKNPSRGREWPPPDPSTPEKYLYVAKKGDCHPRWCGESTSYSVYLIYDGNNEPNGEEYINSILPRYVLTDWYFEVYIQQEYYDAVSHKTTNYWLGGGSDANLGYKYETQMYLPNVFYNAAGGIHTSYNCSISVTEVVT